jgi:hypothetical protein
MTKYNMLTWIENIKIKETKEMEKIERQKLNYVTKERKELKTCCWNMMCINNILNE